MAVYVNSSGQTTYQGRMYNIDDPMMPPALMDSIRENGITQNPNGGDEEETSTVWKVAGAVAGALTFAGAAAGALSKASSCLEGRTSVANESPATNPTPSQEENSDPQSESSRSIFSFLAAAPSASQDPRWAQSERMRQQGHELKHQSWKRVDDTLEALFSKKRPYEASGRLYEAHRKEREAVHHYSEANRTENQIAQDKLKESSSCLLM